MKHLVYKIMTFNVIAVSGFMLCVYNRNVFEFEAHLGRSVDYSTGSKLQGKKWKFQDEGVFHIEFISNFELICRQI